MDEERRWFYLYGGGIIKDIKELLENLKNMPIDVYKYHANEEKNDFAEWIKNVFLLNDLAKSLYGKNREEAIEILDNWLNKKDGNGINEETKLIKDEMNQDREFKPKIKEEVNTRLDEDSDLKKRLLRIEEKFSDKIEPIFPSLDKAMPQNIKDQLEEMKEKLEEIEQGISEHRKKGYEFFETSFLLRIAKSKLNVAKASWERRDIENAKQYIKELIEMYNNELIEAEKIKNERKKFEEEYLVKKYGVEEK